jgi:protein-S-isoprenylcysteine O-methyltransferase Ste14
MYVGLTLLYLGVAVIQVQIWPVLLLPLLAIYIHRIVIPVEEARLREVFGDAYEHMDTELIAEALGDLQVR